MDQFQALNILTKIIDEAKLTRQERDNAVSAIQLLHQVSKKFQEMVVAQNQAKEAAKPAEPKKNPDAPKPTVDIADKSTA